MSSMNFTCDVCGREVFSCTFVNGMKFCAKCYQEIFGNKNMTENLNNMYEAYLKILNEKDQQITNLQNQFAITEKALELACEPRDDWGGREYSGTEYDNYYDYFMAEAKEMIKSE